MPFSRLFRGKNKIGPISGVGIGPQGRGVFAQYQVSLDSVVDALDLITETGESLEVEQSIEDLNVEVNT